MKATILSPRTVKISMSLSELKRGLDVHQKQVYLCMVIQAMASDAMEISHTNLMVLPNGGLYHGPMFKEITEQVRGIFAKLMGFYGGDKTTSSIQSWALGTKYAKGELVSDNEIQKIRSEIGNVYAAFEMESVVYRRVLLERLIEENGDVGFSVVLELVESSSNYFL